MSEAASIEAPDRRRRTWRRNVRHRDRLPAFPSLASARPAAGVVSVIVVNHNYGRFVGNAIDSALAQQGPEVEVVVVDDGSTDGSRALLETYAGHVRVVLQPNQGQSAAFNAGLAAATGDVVIYLDADDALDPQVASRVMLAFDQNPATARVMFRLAVVDEQGSPTGELMPARDVPLPVGDVRRHVLEFGDDLAWPPTSGNAFPTWALRRILPLPVSDDLVDADSWLHPTIPLLGPVVALDAVGGVYRAHGANHAFRERLDVERSRRILRPDGTRA